MNRNIPTIFAILALIVLILCSACASPSSGETKEGGLTQVSIPAETTRISFEEAQQKLNEYRTDSLSGSYGDKKIYYIFARDVDDQGNAIGWVFGVNYGTGTKLLIYDESGWTTFQGSNTTLPTREIAIDRIVSPGDLITQNKNVIQSASSSVPVRKDLELQDGIYKLSIYSDGKGRILAFNATTGVLIG